MGRRAGDVRYVDGQATFCHDRGPQRCGKSTCAKALLETGGGLIPFVNADVIAEGLSGFSPEAAAVRAGRIMVERIEELAQAGQSFAVETTLASRSDVALQQKLKPAYQTDLIFLHLSDPKIAIDRVKHRVQNGGHNIPVKTIIKRYHMGIRNFFQLYKPRVDHWFFYDNSGMKSELWAWGSIDEHQRENKFVRLENQYGS